MIAGAEVWVCTLALVIVMVQVLLFAVWLISRGAEKSEK